MQALLWPVVFAAGAVVLVRAAVVLVAAADDLAEVTRTSRMFVGTLLLASATSLPEAVVDVNAVVVASSPDLAVGDLFGSSMANMAILAGLDLAHRGQVWPSVELGQARLAAVAIGLTAVAVLGVVHDLPRVGPVGAGTLVIGVAYAGALRWMHVSPTAARRVPPGGRPRPATRRPPPPRVVVRRFVLAAAALAVVAPVVTVAAKGIATSSGVSETAVGTTLLALTTSLPELVVSMAALRLGAYDLAVGNLLGSNAANMAVLLVVDLAYPSGSLLAAVEPAAAVAGTGAILLMALALSAVIHGDRTRIGRLEPDAVLLLLTYAALLALVVLPAG